LEEESGLRELCALVPEFGTWAVAPCLGTVLLFPDDGNEGDAVNSLPAMKIT